VLEYAMAIRNFANRAAPLFSKTPGGREDWEIMLELAGRVSRKHGWLSSIPIRLQAGALKAITPDRILDILLRIGPHRLSIKKLEKHPHGLDLGPLEPRIKRIIRTPGRLVRLVPEILKADIGRLETRLKVPGAKDGELLLIGRRDLRGMNTWVHNSPRLVSGRERCVLLVNPSDAAARGISNGNRVKVTSRTGSVETPVEITQAVMKGVVDLPFGWGHARPGTRMKHASEHPGASVNDITDETLVDRVSGASAIYGVPVMVTKV
jgi:anaerobic selenocysteine-containing dehydrogenase